jgi:Flp pilus assembly protein TadG
VDISKTVIHMRTRLIKNERGAALIEAAVTIPIILLISVGIFEFGRAYQTWQVVTNAAREGARVAVINGMTDDQVRESVRAYMTVDASRMPLRPPSTSSGTRRSVRGPDRRSPSATRSSLSCSTPSCVSSLNSTTGAPLTMSAVAIMRNEG